MSNSHAHLNYERRFKIVLYGDTKTGKTSISSRYVDDQFSADVPANIGVDFAKKEVDVDDKKMNLHLWDTAGQKRFRPLVLAYCRGSAAIIIVFDITNKESFENINMWINDVRRDQASPCPPIILIGNKADLEDKRQVTKQEAEAFAQQEGLTYCEVSAKSGAGVDGVFQVLAKQLYDALPKDGKISARKDGKISAPVPGFFQRLWNGIKGFFKWLCCFPTARPSEGEGLLGNGLLTDSIGSLSDSVLSDPIQNITPVDADAAHLGESVKDWNRIEAQYESQSSNYDPRLLGNSQQAATVDHAPASQATEFKPQ